MSISGIMHKLNIVGLSFFLVFETPIAYASCT